MKSFLRLLTLAAVSALPACAGLVVTPDSLVFTGMPGDTLAFRATLTNTGPDTIFLNSDSLSVATDVTWTDLFNNVPLFLTAGQSLASVELFDLTIDPDPYAGAWGSHLGSYDLLGGASDSAQDILATLQFDVQVVPEPATALLWLPALGGLLLARRRRTQARS